jgi:hypothetical protein
VGDGVTDDTAAVQAALYDRGAYFPPGDYIVSNPLYIPRSDVAGFGGTNLIGLTGNPNDVQIRSISGSWTGGAHGIVERAPAVGAVGDITRRWWNHWVEISGVTITAPVVDDGKCVWFEQTQAESVADPTLERVVIRMRNLRLVGYNAYHKALVQFDGNVWNSLFEDIWADPAIVTPTYDTVAFKFKAGAVGLDNLGGYHSKFSRILANAIYGGNCALVTGKLSGCTLENCFVGGCAVDPCISLTNSTKTTFVNCGTEGGLSAGGAAVLLTSCNNVVLQDCGVGLPSAGPAAGDCVSLVGCVNCSVEGLPLYTGNPSLTTLGAAGIKRLRLDANCHNNSANISACSTDTLADVYADAGTNNSCRLYNVDSGVVSLKQT